MERLIEVSGNIYQNRRRRMEGGRGGEEDKERKKDHVSTATICQVFY